MHIQQISVFLENNAGRLAEVTRVLAKAEVNIRAISIADTADFGILRLIVNKTEEAVAALNAAGFTARLTDVMAVEIGDEVGCLADLMELFKNTGVNIEYLYATLEGCTGQAIIIFKVQNLEHGLEIVRQKNIKTVEII